MTFGNSPAHYAQRRASVLSELVRLFTSGNDPLSMATEAVELVADATDATSVFVYFWEPEIERLVLRIVTQADVARGLGSVQLGLGEGITGWSALHRKPVVLPRAIAEDPRFVERVGVQESIYQSLITAPIADGEQLYGVFAMYSVNEDQFSSEELALAEEVGALLASGLRQAETVRDMEMQSAIARFIVDLPSAVSGDRTTALQECARRIAELIDADTCVLEFVPWVGSTSEPIAIAERQPQKPIRVWLTHSAQAVREHQRPYEIGNYDRVSVPLGFGASNGVLTCFRMRRLRRSDAESIGVLGRQVGVLMDTLSGAGDGSRETSLQLASRRPSECLAALRRLGWKGGAFTPVMCEIRDHSTDAETLARVIRSSLSETFGGDLTLVSSGLSMTMLLPLHTRDSSETRTRLLLDWVTELSSRIDGVVHVGMGPTSLQNADPSESIRQARIALDWSASISPHASRLIDYADLQASQQLPSLLEELRPRIATTVTSLAPLRAYDAEHGTQLLATLEIFAMRGGSLLRSAEALFIHRNTLRQRLSRIETLLGLSLETVEDWTEFRLATRLLLATEAQVPAKLAV